MKLSNFVALLGLAAPLSAAAASGHRARGHHSRHTDIARRADADLELWKRTSGSRWTFYDVGLGACGKNNSPGDFIVALNSAQFGGGYPGPNCFKKITMQYNGKTTTATIMDECPGCPYGGLDLSKGLFGFFDSLDKGVLTGNWWFAGDGPAPPAPPPPPPPHTTKKPAPPPPPPSPTHTPKTTPKPTPTTTEAPEKPKTHEEASPKTSSSSSDKASATSASASVNHSSGVASGLAAPAATGSAQDGNLNNINLALVGLGGLTVAGVQAN